MEYIEVICKTNLDNVECFVTKMVALPRIGDKVEVLFNGRYEYLTICNISHRQELRGNELKPYIEVELTNKL